MAELVSELEAQPQRVIRIRQNNIIQSLRRHDWAYRWRQILGCVGLPTTTRLVERAGRLNYVAQAVRCSLVPTAAMDVIDACMLACASPI